MALAPAAGSAIAAILFWTCVGVNAVAAAKKAKLPRQLLLPPLLLYVMPRTSH